MGENIQYKDFSNNFRKIYSKTETDLKFIMLLKGNLPPKMYSFGNILPRNEIMFCIYLNFN